MMAPLPQDGDKSFFYESFASQWDARMDKNELSKRLRLVFGRLLSKEDVCGKRVLDAGAGTGHFSKALADWGARLVSMDLGENLLARIQEKCPTEAVVGSLLDIPLPANRFDLVLCTEVIEHTTDPRRSVAELGRVLAPGGRLVLTVPNRVWMPVVAVANALRLRPYGGHENWVSYRDLRSWVEAGGLQVERQEGFNLLPHTFFCRPAFDSLDRIATFHPYMINIALVARKPP